MTNKHFPFLDGLPAEDQRVFYEEIMAISQQCLDLGTSVERFAERLAENFDTWAEIAEQKREEATSVQPQMILRHHYSYAHQKWVEGAFVNICRECDKPRDHAVHYTSPDIKRSREDARYKSGDTVQETGTDNLWVIQGVSPYSYTLRKLLHEEGETWLSYSWDRDACETASELVNPREL